MIELIVFDIDDTLYSEYDYVVSGFRAVHNYLSSIYGNKDYFNKFLYAFNQGTRQNIFNLVLNDQNIQFDVSVINKLVGIYRAHTPKISLKKDITVLLERISTDGKILAVISDGYLQSQQKKIEALKLCKYFNEIYLTDELGREYWKPNTYYFEKCQSDFEKKPENIVYLGDNWGKDFLPANKLGWFTIGIKSDHNTHINYQVSDEYAPKMFFYSTGTAIRYLIDNGYIIK